MSVVWEYFTVSEENSLFARAKTPYIKSHLPLYSLPQDTAVIAAVERRERAVV